MKRHASLRLSAVEKRDVCGPCRESKRDSSIVQSVYRRLILLPSYCLASVPFRLDRFRFGTCLPARVKRTRHLIEAVTLLQVLSWPILSAVLTELSCRWQFPLKKLVSQVCPIRFMSLDWRSLVWNVLGSNLGWDTSYCDWGFVFVDFLSPSRQMPGETPVTTTSFQIFCRCHQPWH
jgi:hypothetical protein